MKISVIIPTHNRFDILQKCLLALEKQTLDHSFFEVLIGDDGSTDETEKALPDLLKSLQLKTHYFRLPHSGPSAPRNKGIREAKGDILLFLGDDILPAPDCLEKHLQAHASQSDKTLAVIGRVEWDPCMPVTTFMKYLENDIQFSFKNLTHDSVTYRHCYAANTSVPGKFIMEHQVFFSEQIPYVAFEDIEWGYRLMQKGIQFHYAPEALGYHSHQVTLESYMKRMDDAGRAHVHLCRLHPEWRTSGRKNTVEFYIQALKTAVRKRLLSFSFIKKIPGIPEEKWIKSILGYYLERGIRREEKFLHRDKGIEAQRHKGES